MSVSDPDATHRLAAIDIGTVTTRLLIADVSPARVIEVGRHTDITHLGEDLTQTGRLGEAAMKRVADVIERYVGEVRDARVERTTALATSASRDAENSKDFMRMLAAHGIEPHVISGAREANLAFLGATYEKEGEGILVADLGGGSTELILGSASFEGGVHSQVIEMARSIDVGSKRLTELFLESDPPTSAELEEARASAVRGFRSYFDQLKTRPEEMISLAGTATTLSAIKQELAVYDVSRVHNSCLTGSDLADLLEMLASQSLAERTNVVGLDPGRAPVIVAGTLILETLLGMAGLDSTLVSEHDILYGTLLDTYRDLA